VTARTALLKRQTLNITDVYNFTYDFHVTADKSVKCGPDGKDIAGGQAGKLDVDMKEVYVNGQLKSSSDIATFNGANVVGLLTSHFAKVQNRSRRSSADIIPILRICSARL